MTIKPINLITPGIRLEEKDFIINCKVSIQLFTLLNVKNC